MDAAIAEARAAIAVPLGTPGALDRLMSPAEAADTAMSVLLHRLQEAGCLTEPVPAKPAMTLQEAAELLCELSDAPKLQPPAEGADQLIRMGPMVTYAWRKAQHAGIPPMQMSAAFQAKALLTEHHRRAAET